MRVLRGERGRGEKTGGGEGKREGEIFHIMAE